MSELELELKALPPPSNLSPSVLSFLDHQLYNKETLAQAPTLVIDLQSQCHELSHTLIDLNRSLKHTLLSQSTFSDRLHGLLGDVNGKLMGLESLTRSQSSTQGVGIADGVLGKELSSLAKEVARMETVRMYAGAVNEDVSLRFTSFFTKHQFWEMTAQRHLHRNRL